MIKHRTRIGNVFGPVINWAKDLQMEVSYKTIINQFRDGVEQRESVAFYPNFRFDFTANFMGDDAEDFMAEFHRNYAAYWYMPVPFRRQTCEYVLDNGVLDKSKLHFPDGIPFWSIIGASLIIQTDAVRELVTVSALDVPNQIIVLSAPMVTSISQALAFSAIPVQFENDATVNAITSEIYDMRCSVNSVPGLTVFPINNFVAPATLSTRPVVNYRHNWRDDLDHSFKPKVRRTDFGFGRKYQKAFFDFITTVRKYGFTFTSAADIERYLSFIHAMKGRNGSFWYPEWGNLLDLDTTAPPSLVHFVTSNKFIGRNYSGSKTHRNIYIEYMQGDWYAKKITSFQVATPPFTLGFASNDFLPRSPTADNLYQATWLTLNRFATDETVFSFKSADVGEFEAAMQLLPTREVQ